MPNEIKWVQFMAPREALSCNHGNETVPCVNAPLTHWGRVTHIYVSEQTIIGSENGLSPGRRQAIIWTNDGILLIEPLGTNFSEVSIEILLFSFKKMRLKVSSAKWRLFPLGLNVLTGPAHVRNPRRWFIDVFLDGLMQDCRNSSAKRCSYCSITLSSRYMK